MTAIAPQSEALLMSGPVSIKTMRKANLDVEDGVEYPSSDGKPMGETGIHVRAALYDVYCTLGLHFWSNPMVAVQGNMFVYYAQGDPKRCVCPDVFVAMDVPANPLRRSYRIWREGKAPDVVFEITSKKTRKQDLTKKFELYRDVLAIREYFLFDPCEDYLDPSLQGYRLESGRYEPIPWVKGGLPSEVLGLNVERRGFDIRFHDPSTGRLLPMPEDLPGEIQKLEAERLKEEVARLTEEVARFKAEAEVERLHREIESLRRRLPEGEV
jgi:hypothetical protein